MMNINTNKKDALNDDIYITEIYLKQDFRNTRQAPAYKVTAPDGYTNIFRQSMSNGCKEMVMWQHCGCIIDPITETRDVQGCKK